GHGQHGPGLGPPGHHGLTRRKQDAELDWRHHFSPKIAREYSTGPVLGHHRCREATRSCMAGTSPRGSAARGQGNRAISGAPNAAPAAGDLAWKLPAQDTTMATERSMIDDVQLAQHIIEFDPSNPETYAPWTELSPATLATTIPRCSRFHGPRRRRRARVLFQ